MLFHLPGCCLCAFIAIVSAQAALAQPATPNAGPTPTMAEVSVSSAGPVALAAEAGWSKIPEYVAGATIYAKDAKGGDLDLTAKSDGIVLIAASWTYDGNESGGWYESRTAREQLALQGWIALDDLVWNEKDTHTLFFRPVKAGDKLKFHTRKYNQPFVVEVDPARLAALTERMRGAVALAAKARPAAATKPTDKPMTATAPSPARPAEKPAVPAPAPVASTPVARGRDEIQVAGTEQIVLASEDVWSPLPDYLRGATLFQQASGNAIDLTATRDVPVVVAVSWSYDGNSSGGWYPTRKTLPQLVAAGWEPIGKIVQKDKGDYTLLRKSLKAGEKVQFHTRKHNPPVAMLVASGQAKTLAAAAKMQTLSNDLAAIRPAAARPASARGSGVVLRAHEPDRQDRFAQRGLLLRELVRQALLLAAREELGLATRDDALRERGSGGDYAGPLPVDIIVHVEEGGRVNVTVFRLVGERQEILWDKQFSPQGDDLVLALATEAERLSREELLAALKKAGYTGQANRTLEKGPLTADAAALLAEMHPLSQFAAARALHQILHEEGESPERLTALARAYANLSVLTEHLWSPAHKAYKARALLYAQRAATLWPKSPAARAGRAYARALVGLHQAALDDLAATKEIPGASEALRASEANLIEAFCQFDLKKFDAPDLPRGQAQLARVLKLMAVERFSGTATITAAAERVLESVPDSDRAIDALSEVRQFSTRGRAADLGGERTVQGLYRRLQAWDGLPRRAEILVSRAGGNDPAAERLLRLELIRALRAAGDLGADTSEPSWQAVAAWIEEVAFLQSVRQLEFLANGLSVPLDETHEALAPLLADHPYAPVLASLTDAPGVRQARIAALPAVLRPEEATENEDFLWSWLRNQGLPQGQEQSSLAFKHQDWIYRDLLYNVRNSRELAWSKYAGHLRRIAPHSPLTTASTIRFDWAFAEPQAAAWEKQYQDSPQVQGALGRQYLKLEKFDDAIRCLNRWVALQPEYESYAYLAEAWTKKGDGAKFLATWNEYLAREEDGLGHARARTEVAEYLMSFAKWQEAWPYAEAAAGSGAEWAYQCAVDCLTGLARFPEAERYAQASAERYPETAPTWYFWCRRTGQGAAAAASEHVRQTIADPGIEINSWYHGVYLTLQREPEKALAVYRQQLAQQRIPIVAFQGAMLAAELKQNDVRDELLQMAHQAAEQEGGYNAPHLADVAKLAQDALADPSKLPAIAKQLKENVAKVNNPRLRGDAAYLAGKFLLLNGQEAGWDLLAIAVRAPLSGPNSALAAVELRERKDAPQAKK